MKKLSEFKGEQALEILADLIEPCSVIFTDEEVKKAWEEKSARVKLAKLILVKHKSECIDMLCALNEIEAEDFNFNAVEIITMLIQLFEDEELTAFFG